MTEILTRVRGEGSLKTRDLKESTKGKGLWWDHGPGRQALDKLFMQGDLMIRERNGMEKVYVLREQLLPAVVNLQEPTAEEMAAIGLAQRELLFVEREIELRQLLPQV